MEEIKGIEKAKCVGDDGRAARIINAMDVRSRKV